MPTTRTVLPATPRMATSSCPFSPDPPLCHASDSSIQVRSERHRPSRVYPCPRNQVSRLQGQRIELLCLRSRRIGHPQLVRYLDLRSSISSSSRLPESTRLTSAGSTLVPTRTASAVQPTSRTALRATSRTSPARALTPACLPVSLQVQSHPATASTRLDPTRIYPQRGCSLHNLRCQRLELLGLQVGRRMPLDPYTDSILRSLSRNPSRLRSQLERQHQSVPMLRSLLHCMQRQRLELFCLRLRKPTDTSWKPFATPPTCVKPQAFQQVRYQINWINQVYPCSDSTCQTCSQPLELLCLQHREWHLFNPFTTHRLCHASDSSIQVRSERHRLS